MDVAPTGPGKTPVTPTATPAAAVAAAPAGRFPAHDARVARIAADLRARASSGAAGAGAAPMSLGKAAVSHFVPNPHDPRHKDKKLDVRDLREVLAFDPTARTMTAEPGVTFVELVKRTLPFGLIPKLVPELETITIGGAVSGCSVESMSYKYGGFHDSCLEYEALSTSGEVVRCSRTQEPELFDMLHGSYGTLGILTALTFELTPAKPYVHLEYVRHARFEDFEAALDAAQRDPGVDFIDGIIHAPDELVLCLGRFAEAPPTDVRASNYRFLDIFYKSTRTRGEDWLTTADYLFRYDTECHWLTRTLPGMERRPVRLVLGKLLLGSTRLLTWSRRLAPLLKFKRKPEVVVDVFIPGKRLRDFWDWYVQTIDFWPLWVVPYRLPRRYPWVAPAQAAQGGGYYVDCAIYGKRNDTPGVDYSQALEDKTFELGGIKTLISQNHYSRERFWQIYDRTVYQRIKQRMDPAGLLRDLYDKFNFKQA